MLHQDMTVFGCLGDISAGKTTVGKLLAPWGFTLLNYADPLKEIATEGFGWDGIKDARGRRLLQVVGTEAGREYNQNLWVDKLAQSIEEHYLYDKQRRFVICDVRFENEMSWITEQAGGTLLHVRREVAEAIANRNEKPHASEVEWKNAVRTKKFPIIEVDNNGTLPETFSNLYKTITERGMSLM